MLTHRDKTTNSLIVKKEPEQLELFGRKFLARLGGGCFVDLCTAIANEVGRKQHLTASNVARLVDLVVSDRASVKDQQPFSEWFLDYLDGFGMAMNWLPVPTNQTFSRSDRAALASDWHVVQSDVDEVWRTLASTQALAEK